MCVYVCYSKLACCHMKKRHKKNIFRLIFLLLISNNKKRSRMYREGLSTLMKLFIFAVLCIFRLNLAFWLLSFFFSLYSIIQAMTAKTICSRRLHNFNCFDLSKTLFPIHIGQNYTRFLEAIAHNFHSNKLGSDGVYVFPANFNLFHESFDFECNLICCESNFNFSRSRRRRMNVSIWQF